MTELFVKRALMLCHVIICKYLQGNYYSLHVIIFSVSWRVLVSLKKMIFYIFHLAKREWLGSKQEIIETSEWFFFKNALKKNNDAKTVFWRTGCSLLICILFLGVV